MTLPTLSLKITAVGTNVLVMVDIWTVVWSAQFYVQNSYFLNYCMLYKYLQLSINIQFTKILELICMTNISNICFDCLICVLPTTILNVNVHKYFI